MSHPSEFGLGGASGVDPPVPIPNTEVKRPSVHDTAWATGWENRPVPGPSSLETTPDSNRRPVHSGHRRGVEQWQLVGLITRRSLVRIQPPLPRPMKDDE